MLNYITTYGLILSCYSLYFIAVMASNKSGQLRDILTGKGEWSVLFKRMISGIFFLGIGATTLFIKRNPDPAIFMFGWKMNETSMWIYMSTTAISIGIVSASKKLFLAINSIPLLPVYLPPLYVFIRALFLIMYEIFFRGLVLFIMLEDFGITIAIIINLFLYVLVHWFNKKERYGSVLMGIILCGVTIYYYSVWPAIIIHLSLSLSHEITLFINNRAFIKKTGL